MTILWKILNLVDSSTLKSMNRLRPNRRLCYSVVQNEQVLLRKVEGHAQVAGCGCPNRPQVE